MTLARKLAKLAVLVRAEAPARPTYWTEVRLERWCAWANRLLGTMSRDRAVRVYTEMTTVPRDRWGPVARRLDELACLGARGAFHDRWPHYGRVVGLPDAVCEVLEAHPDAEWRRDFSCAECGLEVPHRSSEEWRRHLAEILARGDIPGPEDGKLLVVCPLCGAEVRSNGYVNRQYREAEARVRAEQAAG
jgi:hypothetical protein